MDLGSVARGSWETNRALTGPFVLLAASRETADAGAASDKHQASSAKHQALDSWENIGYKVFGPSSPDSGAMWQWMVPNKQRRKT